MSFEIIIWLFTAFFILHEFEEIVFLNSWSKKNKKEIIDKLPVFLKRVFSSWIEVDIRAFSLAILEEYILLAAITLYCSLSEAYSLWCAIGIAYSIHCLNHIVQCVYIRRYIPAALTALISGVYAVWAVNFIVASHPVNWNNVFIYLLIAAPALWVNLLISQKLSRKIISYF